MTSFPNRVYRTLLTALTFLIPALALAQAEVTPPSDQAVDQPQFSIILNGRDLVVEATGMEYSRELPPAYGQPLDITPNPYVDPAFIRENMPRLAQAGPAGEEPAMEEGATVPGDGPEDEEQTPGFEGQNLDPLDPAAIGLMSQAEAGFPPDLWLGSEPSDLPGLISALPAGTRSPTVNSLLARLLLSPVQIPLQGAGESLAEDLLYARLERLYAAGDIASLMEMFEQIGRDERSPRLTRLMAETYIIDGDFETGCRLSEEGQRVAGSTAFLKINAICLALEGREGEARFNMSLLREENEVDVSFSSLFEDVIREVNAETGGPSLPGGQGSLSSFFTRDFYLLSDLTPLKIGLLKVLDRDVELSLDTNEASNLVLSALARWQGLSLETKLEVADMALSRGILRQRFLKELVGAYEFSAADKENAYLLDYESWGVKSDALFYALALESFDYPEAIHNIQEGWSRARLGGRGAYMAQLFYEAIADIPAEPRFVSFAPDAVRIALLAGYEDKAFEWYMMVRERAATGNAEATRMLVEMWPLMITLDEAGEIPYSPQILTLWRRSLELLPPEEQLGRALLFYETLGILGFEVPEALTAESMLAISGEIGLGEFIGGASMGETILKVLAKLGEEGTVNASPFTLGDALYTLSEAELPFEGRHIVLEALLARGF